MHNGAPPVHKDVIDLCTSDNVAKVGPLILGLQIRTIEGLTELFDASGLEDTDSSSIEIQLIFKDFDDYWSSQAAETIRDITDADVERLGAVLRERLPTDKNGQISFTARANAVRGQVLE